MGYSEGYGPPGRAEREKMIEAHLSLVDFLVDRMMTQVPAFVNRDDIRSAALMGLLDAAGRFDPRRGCCSKPSPSVVFGALFLMKCAVWIGSRGPCAKNNRVWQKPPTLSVNNLAGRRKTLKLPPQWSWIWMLFTN